MKKQFQPDDMKYIRYLSGIAVNPKGMKKLGCFPGKST